MKHSKEELIKAHDFCNGHMKQLKADKVCGCVFCGKIYSPSEIENWLISDNDCDREGTAFCPYCGIDCVIGESSGYPITEEFLYEMHQQWFSCNNPRTIVYQSH